MIKNIVLRTRLHQRIICVLYNDFDRRKMSDQTTQLDCCSTSLMSPQPTSALNHFARTISTPPGLDATLATVCYTSLLVHTQLSKFSKSSNLTVSSSAFKNFYNLLEDTRIYTRLTGLLSLYLAARETWKVQHCDAAVKALLCLSIAAGTAFQLLENIALLVQQNVLRSQSLTRWEAWCWTASNRFWVVALVCDLARLARVRQIGFGVDLETGKITEKESKAGEGGDAVVVLKKKWWRELLVTGASFPLAISWSYPEGESPVSEALLAGAGLASGLVMFGDALEGAA